VQEGDSLPLTTGETVWTIGHSNRSLEEFQSLLSENRIELLVDIRRSPSSRRVPWTNAKSLEVSLSSAGIGYIHCVDLGGFRKPRGDSRNKAWRSLGFRGYADHMETAAFQKALNELLANAVSMRTVVMCAEAQPRRCHRSLLSDALVSRGARVLHILGPGRTEEHRLARFARVRDGRVTYPAPSGAKGLKPGRG